MTTGMTTRPASSQRRWMRRATAASALAAMLGIVIPRSDRTEGSTPPPAVPDSTKATAQTTKATADAAPPSPDEPLPPGKLPRTGLLPPGKLRRPIHLGLGFEEPAPPVSGAPAAAGPVPNPVVAFVEDGSLAAEAGLRPGDVVLEYNGKPVTGLAGLQDSILATDRFDPAEMRIRRGDAVILKVISDGLPGAGGAGARPDGAAQPHPAGPGTPVRSLRLAVVGVDFAEVAHNPDIAGKSWEDMLFSRGTYARRADGGGPAAGSCADYFAEQSAGVLRLEGRFLGWWPLPVRKADLAVRAVQGTDWPQAVADVLARDGRHDLAGYDAVCFLYAGPPAGKAGTALWPHQSTVTVAARAAGAGAGVQPGTGGTAAVGGAGSGGGDGVPVARPAGDGVSAGKRQPPSRRTLPYIVVAEGGRRFPGISVFAHEIGHLLGLPDQYGAGGEADLGPWCLMAGGHKAVTSGPGAGAGVDRPNHLCPWCKMALGWLRPVPIAADARVRVRLAPVEGSGDEAVQVLLQPDGSEYLLLEHRARRGFDADLPAEGLLVWRVTDFRRVELEPADGLRGLPLGRRAAATPFPQGARTAVTPHTNPSGRARTPHGRDAWLTDIRREGDGTVSFRLGREAL